MSASTEPLAGGSPLFSPPGLCADIDAARLSASLTSGIAALDCDGDATEASGRCGPLVVVEGEASRLDCLFDFLNGL